MAWQCGLPMMPLTLAFMILFITFVAGGGYVCMKIWFYFLNLHLSMHSAGIRDKLAKEVIFSEASNHAVFVGFFHPYWFASF
jgi:hypothetical protein